MEWKKLYEESSISIYIKENKVIVTQKDVITMKQYESVEAAQYESNLLKFLLEAINDSK